MFSNKINVVNLLNEEAKPEFFCVFEHWCSESQLNCLFIQRYKKLSRYCRSSSIHGGVVIYVVDTLESKCKVVKAINKMSSERCIECVAITFNNEVCIVTKYRPPSGDYDVFLEHLGKIIMIAISKCKNIIICGDLFIDKLNSKDIRNKKLNDLFNSFELLSLVTVPTRVVTTIRGTSATSIDYVVTNIKNNKCKVFDPGFSDHLAQSFTWENNREVHVNDNNGKVIYRRIINNKSMSEFKYLFNKEYLNLDEQFQYRTAFRNFLVSFCMVFAGLTSI